MLRIVLMGLLGLASTSYAADLPPRYAAVAAAEREFAATGARDGVQKSFLAHFAADSVVLRPFTVSGLAWYREHADPPGGKLVWGPQWLAVSGAGDLALSSGPWRFESERDGKAVSAHGHFLSLWRRNAQGRWQVLLDHGIGHPAPATAVEQTQLEPILLQPADALPAGMLDTRKAALAAADDALRARLRSDPKTAYAEVTTAQTLWLRDGALPLRALAAAASPASPACGCGPRRVLTIAASGELGYTVGGAESARAQGADVRVWRFAAGHWSVLADANLAVE